MKEFPAYDALKFLVGRKVSNIIFQPFSIDIGFDDNSFLVVEHLLEHFDDNGSGQILYIKKGFGPVRLHKIVGREVAEVDRQPFSLAIRFANGHLLKVISIPGPLESGHISREGDVLAF
jgi:hypothetical protein